MERQLLVTNRAKHLRQNIPISVEEIYPGAKLKTTVESIKPNGLTVRIGNAGLFG